MTKRRFYRWGQIFWSGPTTSRWAFRRFSTNFVLRLGRFGLVVKR